MSECATLEPDPCLFNANLAALRRVLPSTADRIASTPAPQSLTLASGRDGARTFKWTDETGQVRWLGRTSMPTLSCEALAAAFQPGGGNTLLFTFGQGGEVSALLRRLADHQAIIAIDETPWAVAAALQLRDFAADIDRRRLLVFVGPSAWDECRQFLTQHEGFLLPERILSWPWFEPETAAFASNQLAAIQTSVAKHRTESRPVAVVKTAAQPPDGAQSAVALVSNVPHPNVHRLARRLAAGADAAGVRCSRFVLDSPLLVHPRAIEKTLAEFRPTLHVLIDVPPDALGYALPEAPVLILCSHAEPLPEEWLKRVPSSARLGVRTEGQRRAAIKSGIPESHLVFLPPAALPGLATAPRPKNARVLVIGDDADPTARSAGLHLVSHRQLWGAATRIIDGRIDAYNDSDTADVFTAAERMLGIRIDSDEVRNGLIERIRLRLGPVLMRRAYCLALAEAGIEFDLFGRGWEQHESLRAFHRGPWPAAEHDSACLADYGALLALETSGHVEPWLLDGLAAGLVGLVRSHPLDETRDGLAAVLRPDRHVVRFGSRSDLVEQVLRLVESPEAFSQQAVEAMNHINAAHTWRHRIQTIIEVCRGQQGRTVADGHSVRVSKKSSA